MSLLCFLSIPFIGIFALHRIQGHLALGFTSDFQFPLLGFLLCIQGWRRSCHYEGNHLSIPFIGIFALHPTQTHGAGTTLSTAFNSLYWDFCFASKVGEEVATTKEITFQFPLLGFLLCIRLTAALSGGRAVTFNSLYWDFCFASSQVESLKGKKARIFQFPLLGFLLCIERIKFPCERWDIAFNSLYWDFCFASTG